MAYYNCSAIWFLNQLLCEGLWRLKTLKSDHCFVHLYEMFVLRGKSSFRWCFVATQYQDGCVNARHRVKAMAPDTRQRENRVQTKTQQSWTQKKIDIHKMLKISRDQKIEKRQLKDRKREVIPWVGHKITKLWGQENLLLIVWNFGGNFCLRRNRLLKINHSWGWSLLGLCVD